MIQLTPAQQAYYDLLVTLPGQGTPNEIRAYVAGLNDAQALVSLDSTARAYRVIASDPVADQLIRGQDGFTTTAYLAEKYDVEGPLLQGSTGDELVYIEKVSAPNQDPVYEIVEKAIVEPVTGTGTPVEPVIYYDVPKTSPPLPVTPATSTPTPTLTPVTASNVLPLALAAVAFYLLN